MIRHLLTHLRHPDGRHEVQIFVGLIGNQVVGLVQVLYRRWQLGLLADIDLLGVLEPDRRLGLGSTLVKQAIQATQDLAACCGLPAVGVVSLADPMYTPIIRLHQKLEGQIRTDTASPCGDVIIWYPLSAGFTGVETSALARQLREFGRLLEAAGVSG